MISLNNFPSHIQLQTHSLCNLKCKLCPHPLLGKNKIRDKLSIDLFKKIVDECASKSEFKSITLDLQNEPLLDENLEDKIRYIKDKREDVFIGITTNAVNLNKKRTERLIESGVSRIVVSLNATNEKEFSEIVDTVPFSKILKNLKSSLEVKGASKFIKVSFGITGKNILSARNFISYFSSKNIMYRIFSMNDRVGELVSDSLIIKEENNFDVACKRNGMGSRHRICQIPMYAMTIKYNGDVITCCEDWKGEKTLGNVTKQKISEVWLHENNVIDRKNIINNGKMPANPCANCKSARTIPYPISDSNNDREFLNSTLAFTKDKVSNTTNVIPVLHKESIYLRNIFNGRSLSINSKELEYFESNPHHYVSSNMEALGLNKSSKNEFVLPFVISVNSGELYSGKYIRKDNKIICDKTLEKSNEYLVKSHSNGLSVLIKPKSENENIIYLSNTDAKNLLKFIEYCYGFVS